MKCKQNLGERGVQFLRAVKSTQRTYSAHFSSSKGSGRNRRSISSRSGKTGGHLPIGGTIGKAGIPRRFFVE